MNASEVVHLHDGRHVVRVHNPEMWPRYRDGEIAVFDKAEPPDAGEDVIVEYKDGRILARRLVSVADAAVSLGTFAPEVTELVSMDAIKGIYPVVERVSPDSWDRFASGSHIKPRKIPVLPLHLD